MKFRVTQRMAAFGKLNVRNERHGQEKVPAADLRVTFQGTKRDLDMLFPLMEGKLSDMLYDANGKLQVPYMSPLKNHRTPENVNFTVWDQATKRSAPLKFEGCKIKIVEVALHDKRNITVELTIQLHDDPDENTARLRQLMDNEREFSLESQQEDFFDEDPEEKEDKQGQLPVDVEQGPAEEEEEE